MPSAVDGPDTTAVFEGRRSERCVASQRGYRATTRVSMRVAGYPSRAVHGARVMKESSICPVCATAVNESVSTNWRINSSAADHPDWRICRRAFLWITSRVGKGVTRCNQPKGEVQRAFNGQAQAVGICFSSTGPLFARDRHGRRGRRDGGLRRHRSECRPIFQDAQHGLTGRLRGTSRAGGHARGERIEVRCAGESCRA